jgi:hypothetical protein
MIGSAAGIAVLLMLTALAFHYFKWSPRVVSGLLCSAAVAALVAVARLIGSVWAFTEHGTGLVLLLVLTILPGILFYGMVIRGHRHHAIASGAVAIVFGMTAVLIIGGWRHVLSGSATGLKSAGAAAGSIWNGNGATAVQSAGRGSGGGTVALVAFAAVIVACALVFIRVHRRGRGRTPARREG